jgi:hypothetical protein
VYGGKQCGCGVAGLVWGKRGGGGSPLVDVSHQQMRFMLTHAAWVVVQQRCSYWQKKVVDRYIYGVSYFIQHV